MFRRYTCNINDVDSIGPHNDTGLYSNRTAWNSAAWRGMYWQCQFDTPFGLNRNFIYFQPIEFQFFTSYDGIVPCTPIAVDTFFAISGLLVSYKMFKLIKKWGALKKLQSNFTYLETVHLLILEMDNWTFCHCIGIVIYG